MVTTLVAVLVVELEVELDEESSAKAKEDKITDNESSLSNICNFVAFF